MRGREDRSVPDDTVRGIFYIEGFSSSPYNLLNNPVFKPRTGRGESESLESPQDNT
jgi:hypothetical protein